MPPTTCEHATSPDFVRLIPKPSAAAVTEIPKGREYVTILFACRYVRPYGTLRVCNQQARLAKALAQLQALARMREKAKNRR